MGKTCIALGDRYNTYDFEATVIQQLEVVFHAKVISDELQPRPEDPEDVPGVLGVSVHGDLDDLLHGGRDEEDGEVEGTVEVEDERALALLLQFGAVRRAVGRAGGGEHEFLVLEEPGVLDGYLQEKESSHYYKYISG